jgi:hypothetical protein
VPQKRHRRCSTRCFVTSVNYLNVRYLRQRAQKAPRYDTALPTGYLVTQQSVIKEPRLIQTPVPDLVATATGSSKMALSWTHESGPGAKPTSINNIITKTYGFLDWLAK